MSNGFSFINIFGKLFLGRSGTKPQGYSLKLNEREEEIGVGPFSWKSGEEKLISTWSEICDKGMYMFKTMN